MRKGPWSWLAVAALAALLVLSRVTGTVPLPSLAVGSGSAATTDTSDDMIAQVQLVTDQTGWEVTNDHLQWTTDNGGTWKDITPDGVVAGAIEGVWFQDEGAGWLVAADPATADDTAVSSSVYHTADGGASWQRAELPGDGPGGTAYIDFTTRDDGWVMIHDNSGSSVSLGELFQTTDGGATWRRLPDPPIGGKVSFTSASDGWLAGGPVGDELYRTTDGGNQWNRVSVELPTGFRDRSPSYDTPTFFDDANGVLPVTLASPNSDASVAYYTTGDGGESWSLAATEPTNSIVVGPAGVPTDIVSLKSWVQVDPNGNKVTAVTGDSAQATTTRSDDLDSGSEDTQWTDSKTGWDLASDVECLNGKQDCHETTELLSTSDGGATWDTVDSAIATP
jgi:hypothetical protein